MNGKFVVVASAAVISLGLADNASSYNAVWVESKTVAPGATGVIVNVWVVNETPLTGFELPLEFRDTDGNGSYIAASCIFGVPENNRIGASPLAQTTTKSNMGSPTDTTCFSYKYPDGWVIHPLCCGPVGHSYNTNSPVNFVSPDGFYWSGVSFGGPPDLWYLPPGNDSIGGVHRGWPADGDSTLYPAGPSFNFVFTVNAVEGTFEIDTMCVCPDGHLRGSDTTVSVNPVFFEFRRGVITISASPNEPPEVMELPSATVAEGDSLDVAVAASDPNGTCPTLSAENLPPNAVFSNDGCGTGLLSFKPDFTQAGSYNVFLYASDGELADTALLTITVTNTNRAPVLAAIGPKSVDEGQNLTFRVSASDPDATPLTLTAEPVPSRALFTDSTNGAGSFVFDPDFTQSGTYDVRFIASDSELADIETVRITVNDVTAIRSLETGGGVPTEYLLEPNYPNPFNAGTVIRFTVPHDGRVRLDVFDVLGRRVRSLLDDVTAVGTFAVDWDGADDRGRPLASGIYFYRLQADDYSKIRSMVLLR